MRLVKNLAASLKDRIQGLSWMSKPRPRPSPKWETFTKIGYPDKWRDWSGLQPARQLPGQRARGQRVQLQVQPVQDRQAGGQDRVGRDPQTVNAYYNPLQNEIVFPAAILQPPFFDPKADDALNYGGIGAVIGHEMTHGYDDQGARFGPTGNMETGGPRPTRELRRPDRQAGQSSSTSTRSTAKAVNGHLTWATSPTWAAWLPPTTPCKATAGRKMRVDGFTRDQRFLASTGPPCSLHRQGPPGRRRSSAPWVRRPNLPTFAAAFQCKAGSPMARTGEQQVVIW